MQKRDCGEINDAIKESWLFEGPVVDQREDEAGSQNVEAP
jgi:hypothetical protein